MSKNQTVTFFSNFLLHHQTPFCEAMVSMIGNRFHFVATTPIPQDRLGMGYHDYTQEHYAVNAYQNESSFNYAMKLGEESDVVILGDAPDCFIEKRLKEGKLTFRYNERFFKNGKWRILDPRVLRYRYSHDIKYRNSNLYMLCASAYTALDCRFIHSYPNKTYKWGYFPEIKKYDNVEAMIGLKQPASILWVGRLIGWKHPEATVFVAEKLKKQGYHFELNMIGEGDKKPYLQKLIQEKDLEDCVHLHGFMSPELVREYMERTEIYLFTSDHNEGWGAVLNESMNSACAVVACEEIGSVPYLIEDGVNGFSYSRKKKDDLCMKVKWLLDDEKLRRSMQLHAYESMIKMWNANTAAERFLKLADYLSGGSVVEYDSGPCSKD